MVADPSVFVQHVVLAVIGLLGSVVVALIARNGHQRKYHHKDPPGTPRSQS